MLNSFYEADPKYSIVYKFNQYIKKKFTYFSDIVLFLVFQLNTILVDHPIFSYAFQYSRRPTLYSIILYMLDTAVGPDCYFTGLYKNRQNLKSLSAFATGHEKFVPFFLPLVVFFPLVGVFLLV